MPISTGLQGAPSSQVQGQAHELPFGRDAMQASQAELAEPTHGLDPSIGRLGDPLALSICRIALFAASRAAICVVRGLRFGSKRSCGLSSRSNETTN
jgi:hypothetical protein